MRLPVSFFLLVSVAASGPALAQNALEDSSRGNLALVAIPTGSGHPGVLLTGLNDGFTPAAPGNRRPGARPPQHTGTQWVEYDWMQPIRTREIAVYWWNYTNTVQLPRAYRVQYWDGTRFVLVQHPVGLGLANNQYNVSGFDEITTTRLRLELDSTERFASTILEWKVYPSQHSPAYPPVVIAGPDRDVMAHGKTYLAGSIKSVLPVVKRKWIQVSGPGKVEFSHGDSNVTSARFSKPGHYLLRLYADQGGLNSSSTLLVKVVPPPQDKRLDVVYTRRYKIESKLWNARAKALIVHWIPFCIDQINRADLKTGEGGIDNFIEAAKALRGEMHATHKGYVFSNAWVHQTVEAMCEALMVDAGDDPDIIAAQEKMKQTLARWIPLILAAQEPDGYLQTAFTLRDTSQWHERWTPEGRGNHEGYVSGYFIESAINHYTLTEGKDKRLYNAAKKLADCWVTNIGPGKKAWYDGHQEMEQALVRFGRFVNDMEGHGRGDSYIRLAKFLLDNRGNGTEYDQSQSPVQEQYEAVGHAVRATYTYSGMADVAAETGDVDYQSAVLSLWDNLVNKKYYITGGIGSGETSEGFGGNYSLGNDAYCESCSSCGLIFFQYKMNLAYHDAKYADLYEETLYNALLGALDLDGKDFFYDNPLASSQGRYQWHVCPCCVGNIPRTLLMMPTWTYVRGDDGLYVNLFIGSTIHVDKVAGTEVEMIQQTDYPWSGKISMTVNPKESRSFTVYVRIPNRRTSELYTPVPQVSGFISLSVNGKTINPAIRNGYAVIRRAWKKGDHIELELPMQIQEITADAKIKADIGRVALRYGPLLYNVETADHQDINQAIGNQPLSLEWNGDLLRGIMTIKGYWADGTPLLAIPNFTRLNRVQPTPLPPDEEAIAPAQTNHPAKPVDAGPSSILWIKK
jgi:uncharacterized protein